MCSNGLSQLATAVTAACAAPVGALSVTELQQGVAAVAPLADRLGGYAGHGRPTGRCRRQQQIGIAHSHLCRVARGDSRVTP